MTDDPTDGTGAPGETAADPVASGPLTIYWRPGCVFCSSLLRGLERDGLRLERVNIWEDEAGAAFVRSVAGGNETVPTVRVADIALVNPSRTDVLRELAERAPEHLPDGFEVPEPGRLERAVTRLLGG